MLTRVPWWLDEAPPDPEMPPLAGEATADVAIVVGGYTGLWTALELRRRDPARRVVVLEAEHVGFGPSGRNGGFLETYWCALPRLRSRLGDDVPGLPASLHRTRPSHPDDGQRPGKPS